MQLENKGSAVEFKIKEVRVSSQAYSASLVRKSHEQIYNLLQSCQIDSQPDPRQLTEAMHHCQKQISYLNPQQTLPTAAYIVFLSGLPFRKHSCLPGREIKMFPLELQMSVKAKPLC